MSFFCLIKKELRNNGVWVSTLFISLTWSLQHDFFFFLWPPHKLIVTAMQHKEPNHSVCMNVTPRYETDSVHADWELYSSSWKMKAFR